MVYQNIHYKSPNVYKDFSRIEYDHLHIHMDIDNQLYVNFQFLMNKHFSKDQQTRKIHY